MPDFKPYTKNQLFIALNRIGEAVYTAVAPLDIRAWCTSEPLPFSERQQGNEHRFKAGDKWGGLFDCAWFHFTGVVPESAAGKPVVLLLDVNGEMCVVDPQGTPLRGLTSVSSDYDFTLGAPGKRVCPILEKAKGGEKVDVWADAGCNDLFGNLKGNGTIKEASIATCNERLRGLYYDFEVLLDFLKSLPEDSPRYQQILVALNDVEHLLYRGPAEVAEEARKILAPHLARRGGDPALRISAVGHAHMDLGWLWPIRETIRKGARTFATAISWTERFPDYVFGASQPQLYQWMKERYPALYEKIKAKVKEGRIEPQGVMWVEADTNISGGEALVRQVLQGTRFWQKEFGREVRYLWLPDVFGYSGSLPQILVRSGAEFFSTQKISWSLINRFPHHSFYWQGIDGTRILSHMLPEDTYNGPAAPRSVRKIEQNYRDKGISSYSLMVFGIGDGGGGPGEEHLERLERIRNLEGLSPVKLESAAAFFEQWSTEAARFPTWVGELYLERHEGTLTTEARNKWSNRKMELGLRELEWSAVQANILAGTPYPAEKLELLWREMLLYQFHDILPGSSIKRVYDESLARYRVMLKEMEALVAANDDRLAEQIDTRSFTIPVLVQNSLSWERKEWIQIPNSLTPESNSVRSPSPGGRGERRIPPLPMGEGWVLATVLPMGYTVIEASSPTEEKFPVSAAQDVLENDLLSVHFNEDGSISSIHDKRLDREVLPKGSAGNRLAVYVDLGDAWDFAMDYAEQTPRFMQLASSEARLDGPRAILKQVYRLNHSELIQEIILTAGRPRLDFVSQLHWRETQTMLRTSFPVAVHADEATFEIQYGHLRRPTHRNTTWDLARDEVCAHKWVDLSQGDYGVALLNDCKYGHKVKGNVIDLNLLRSVPYPGPRLVQDADVAPGEPHHAYTDQADHRFTYALYPHAGGLRQGRVIQAAYELNVPLRARPVEVRAGKLPAQTSFLEVESSNIIIEAVKVAETALAEDAAEKETKAIIVRLYESEHSAAETRLRIGFPVKAAYETNLMEQDPEPLEIQDNAVRLTFRPFEIKTVKLVT